MQVQTHMRMYLHMYACVSFFLCMLRVDGVVPLWLPIVQQSGTNSDLFEKEMGGQVDPPPHMCRCNHLFHGGGEKERLLCLSHLLATTAVA